MTSAAAVLRTRRRDAARPWPNRTTKTVSAAQLRSAAATLAKYANLSSEVAENALALLDHADELDVSPRAGWFPKRPKGWRP